MSSFQEMQLSGELLKSLAQLKFTNATPIQEKTIPISLTNVDIMACAETGSGKTAAYGIPIVEKLLADDTQRALILAPTRELVHQIADFLRELTAHCEKIRVTSLVGGADMRKQLKILKKHPRIIVATPGRLTDHLKRQSLNLHTTRTLVLDEGDRMLDMGFAPQLDVILKYLPRDRQTSLFTATLPEKVKKLANKYLSEPRQVNVGRISLPVASIKQSVVEVGLKEKDDRLVDELNQREGSVIVFVKTKHRTDIITKHLKSFGFAVDLIHGDRSQGQRNKAIQNFREGRSRILCATDIAARGLDVPQVEHVINMDLPMMEEDYVHRIGRTARNGAKGEAVSFVMPNERRTWQALVRKYKISGVNLEGGDERGGRKGRRSDRKTSRFAKSERPNRERPEKRSDRNRNSAKPRFREEDDAPLGKFAKKKKDRFEKRAEKRQQKSEEILREAEVEFFERPRVKASRFGKKARQERGFFDDRPSSKKKKASKKKRFVNKTSRSKKASGASSGGFKKKRSGGKPSANQYR